MSTKKSRIVTLTSDLGTADYHIAAVKGLLLKMTPSLTLVDISHQIRPHHYIQAAFVLSQCFKDFPEGTVHLVGVEGDFIKGNGFLVAKLEKHIFFVKNNGLLTLISDQAPDWVYRLNCDPKWDFKFPFKLILAKAASLYLNGVPVDQLGVPELDFLERRHREPILGTNSITGVITVTNQHGNVVTNIHRKHFEGFTGFSSCKVHYNKMDYFKRICHSYQDVGEGVAACFFGSSGYLEIGINGGGGQKLLSLNEGKNILIEFD